MSQEKTPFISDRTIQDILNQRDKISQKYILATATEDQLRSLIVLLRWLEDSEDKDDYLDNLTLIDLQKVLSTKMVNLVIQLHPLDPVKFKAVDFGIIKKKT